MSIVWLEDFALVDLSSSNGSSVIPMNHFSASLLKANSKALEIST